MADLARKATSVGFPPVDTVSARSAVYCPMYEAVHSRILSKIEDYKNYKFSSAETSALNIFFDLAQEYLDVEHLHLVPIGLLRTIFSIDAEFYANDQQGACVLATPEVGWVQHSPVFPEQVANGPCEDAGRFCIPVRWRNWPAREGAVQNDEGVDKNEVLLGVLVLYPRKKLTRHEKLYYEKFANRIGSSLYNSILAQKNKDHIKFVRNLVQDIGHNVLGPNMHFKLLINQLDSTIVKLGNMYRQAAESGCGMQQLAELHALQRELLTQGHEVRQHFNHTSLFLESLLRESHFVHGQYVLRRTPIDLIDRVVRPQFKYYKPRLADKDIGARLVVSRTARAAARVDADTGLISQVLANLFSNAFKYTERNARGHKAHMRCQATVADNFFGEGRNGIKIAVRTTGSPIVAEESGHLFEKYFRASNASNVSGTGKGLHFVHEIVQSHGGVCGYERESGANVFYFVLPII